MRDKRMSLKDAVAKFIKDGDNVAIGGFVDVRQPVATTHEMIRQGFKDLTLSWHSAGMAPEFLGGAMIVKPDHCSIKRIELAYWAHEGLGLSQAWRVLAENAMVEFEDWSNYNMSARFKAGAMGLPFLPTRGPLGGDIKSTSRTKIVDCPFTGRPIGLVPASNPNVALIHVQAADMYGNCLIRGSEGTDPEIAMAAAHTIVTCEQIVSHELLTKNPNEVAVPFAAVDAVVHVPFGAYPGACRRHYYFSSDYIRKFLAIIAQINKGAPIDTLKAWYDENIFGVANFEEYIAKMPVKQLLNDQAIEAYNYEALA